MLGLCTVVAIFAALYFARAIFVPVTFSVFIIALVWPLQSALQRKIPTLLALAITISVTAIVISVVAFLLVWGFGVVGQWLFRNSARYQELYANIVTWLDGHGIYAAGLIAEYFNVNWVLRAFQQLTGRVHGLVTFVVTTLVFLLLGLLEVPSRKTEVGSFQQQRFGRGVAGRVHDHCSQVSKVHGRSYRNERGNRHRNLGIFPARRGRARDGMGSHCLCFELHPVHRTVRRYGLSQHVCHRAVRIVANGAGRLYRPQSHPIPDRQLSGAPCCGRGAINIPVCGAVFRVFLVVSVGHSRCVHRRADHDCGHHDLWRNFQGVDGFRIFCPESPAQIDSENMRPVGASPGGQHRRTEENDQRQHG